jgi:hypothetical protein
MRKGALASVGLGEVHEILRNCHKVQEYVYVIRRGKKDNGR